MNIFEKGFVQFDEYVFHNCVEIMAKIVPTI